MGIVHDDSDLFIGVGVDLHPSGDPGLHQTREGVLLRHPHRLAHRQGGQGVLDIEQAGHGQPELPAVPGGLDPEKDVSPHFADLGAEDGGRRVLLGEGNHSRAALPGRLQHPVGVVAVQVHAGRGGLGKNPQLGGKIVLEIRVLNGRDVVHADVQEDCGGKLHVFTRSYFSAWLETSMVRYRMPVATPLAKWRSKSRGSGVVRWDSNFSTPS